MKENSGTGGFRWAVVLSAFAVCFITDGSVYSFGVIFVELLEVFQGERASVAVVGSLANGVMYAVGPLAGYLADKYGCRAVAVVGSVISCVGYVGSTFVPAVPYLYVTYGLMGGMGFGLMFLSANVSVMRHFNKRRSLATGIAVCGSGVGSFVFSQLFRYLLDQYGWRGTILILAGISLHGVACGLLFIPPDNDKKQHTIPPANRTDKRSIYIKRDSKSQTMTHELNMGINICTINGSTVHLPIDSKNGKHGVLCDRPVTETKYYSIGTHDVTVNTDIVIDATLNHSQFEDNLEEQGKVQQLMEKVFSVSLLHNPKFVSVLATTFLINLAFMIPYSLIPDQANETGMSKSQGSWLASSIGLSNIVGKIAIGWVGDKDYSNKMVLLCCSLFLAGIATALSPLLVTFQTKIVYTCIYGFLIGGCAPLIFSVVAEIFNPEFIHRSFGLFMLSYGISGVVSTPIGGLIFDRTGSYHITFVVAGSELFVAGMVILVLLIFEKIKLKKNII